MSAMVEQFIYDLDDWLVHRASNVCVSRKLIERTKFLPLWINWLRERRLEDGLPEHVYLEPLPPKEVA